MSLCAFGVGACAGAWRGGRTSNEPLRPAPVSAPEAAARLPGGGAYRALPSKSIARNRESFQALSLFTMTKFHF